MKTVRIIALHLAYGGIEKAITCMANLFAQRYDVEIISVYDMPGAPAFPLSDKVRVRYLLKEIPNREQWHKALREKRPLALLRESFKSVKILAAKKRAVRETIRSVKDGVLITTRHEDNLVLSKYGNPGVFKIAQLHHDHRFEKKYTEGIAKGYQNIDLLVMLTPGLAEEAAEMLGPEARTKTAWVPNFLERYPENVELSGREKLICAVGRLVPDKGFDRLLRCFQTVHEAEPGWKLEIIGEGAERGRLEEMIDALGLKDAVTLTGRLSAPEVEREMLRSSIFAMSSRSEGFGFVIIEAQSCGLPTVAFDVRVGPGFLLTQGREGYLVPDGEEEAYAARLLELIRSPELRKRMGAQALLRARDFSMEKTGERWFSLIGD